MILSTMRLVLWENLSTYAELYEAQKTYCWKSDFRADRYHVNAAEFKKSTAKDTVRLTTTVQPSSFEYVAIFPLFSSKQVIETATPNRIAEPSHAREGNNNDFDTFQTRYAKND